MPTGTVSARPDALLHFLGATVPRATTVMVQGPVLDAALAQAGAGGLRGRAALPSWLGQRLAAHGRGAITVAEATAATGVAFAVAGGPLGILALLRPFAGADDDTIAAFVAATLGVPIDGSAIQPSELDPDVVAQLAATLSPQQLARLAAHHPRLVGPIDGMPVQLRYAANQVLIAEHARTLEATGLGEQAEDLRARYLCSQILFFDPAGGGRIAEVYGDLDAAENIAVVVPGMGNSLANFTGHTREKGVNLFAEAGPGTAVISWLGYDSPGWTTMALDDDALDGADDLVRLFDGLRDDALRTVVGHSYGTVVTAAALRRGLEVDQVVVTGSPGMLADTAREVAGSIPIYASRAPLDGVGWTENFGRDPADPRFGATRIDTGNAIFWHSDYFEPGTESLENIGRIVTGNTDELTTIEPGPVEHIIDFLDDVHTTTNSEIDTYQQLAAELVTGASWVVDGVEGVVPDPVAWVLDTGQEAAGTLYEINRRTIDLTQRLASPGFLGDVGLDLWDLGRDHLPDLAEDLVDVTFDAGRDVVEGVGDLADGAGDLVGGVVGGAGDLVGGLIP